MKIVLIESLAVDRTYIEKLAAPLKEHGHEFVAFDKRAADPAELKKMAGDADIVIEGNQPLGRDMLKALEKCRYISVGFSGVDHVDAATAREMGITVSNSAGYANDSVPELALGMMLGLLRNIPLVDKACREGKTKDGLVGNELRGKTVGIIGMGGTGYRMAEILNIFDCNIVFSVPHVRDNMLKFGRPVSLDELLAVSDIVTLHCPLTDETRGLIGKEQIEKMKKTAILINTSRGPVVDSGALADALNEGRIAGAGVDVFETEPPIDVDHPLLKARNCIVTPHVAFATKESMIKRADIAFNNVYRYLEGDPVNIKI